ncbi:ychF [Symbiodinium natans]|uniref:YchF protein n=1 Tax=Symbiodinium natans TaxID=878477 RepID=A0A812TSS5_9DINO|nr:ychF [Symbiodinium natans]
MMGLPIVPAARLTFFAYVILLHAWVLFILQQMALHPSASLEHPERPERPER